MPDTSYHGWTMPTVDGSTDTWGTILNAMFDNEIDADVERRGTLANRPAAVDVPDGAKYVVTSGSEAGRVFIESADSWVTLGTADLESGALDAIAEIDAALRSGVDTTLITGTAGTSGNVPQYNSDGDIVDSGKAASDIGTGSGGTVDVENSDGTTLTAASAIQAGTNLDFVDDGDNTATLNHSGTAGSGLIDTVVGNGDSLQDAINAVGDRNSINILWDGINYDPSVETWPVTLDCVPQIWGKGQGENARIFTGASPSEAIFEIDVTSATPAVMMGFHNLHIRGGRCLWDFGGSTGDAVERMLTTGVDYFDSQDGAFDLTNSTFAGWQTHIKLTVSDFVNTGMDMSGGVAGPNNSSFYDCQIRRGGDGSTKPQDGATAGTGQGLIYSGFGINWYGGNIEKLAGKGVQPDQVQSSNGTLMIDGCYHESVAKAETGADNTIYDITNSGHRNKVIRNVTLGPGGTAPTYFVVCNDPNLTIETPVRQDADAFGNPGEYQVLLESGADDARLNYDSDKVPTTINSGAERYLWHGTHGDNNGSDPSTGGPWNGNGVEGAVVEGDASTLYTYLNGSWKT